MAMFKRLSHKLTKTPSLVNKEKKIDSEYTRIFNDVAHKFYILTFIVVTFGSIILGITALATHGIPNGIILLSLGTVLVGIMYFRERCRRIIPVIAFVGAQIILGWGLFFVSHWMIDKLDRKTIFYLGYSFAMFHAFMTQIIPQFRFQFIFAAIAITVRYVFMIPDSAVSIVSVTVLDITILCILYYTEKHRKSMFTMFYDYREELSKFKSLLSSHLPENIVILNKDLNKKFFCNETFTNSFQVQTPEDICNVFSTIKINTPSYEQSFSNVNLLSPLPSPGFPSPTPSHSQLFPLAPNPAQSLKDFLISYKDFMSNDQNIVSFNAQREHQGTRHLYSAKVFHLSWDNSDAIVIMLNDVTQQETILALKLADENKDNLLATVSHELRTPINGMLGVTQIMESEYRDPKLLSYVKTAKICSTLLLNLVNSILDLTQIRKNCIKLNPTRFKLAELLEEVEVIFKSQCALKNIDFTINVDDDVSENLITDYGRLMQVIVNLLSNALKFTFKGGIRLSVSPSKDKDEIIFVIEDTGIGIKTEDHHKLFKMFGRLDTMSPKINNRGVGLGLTISNSLVSILNPNRKDAHIDFKSKFGQGTTFYFAIGTKLADIIDEEKSLGDLSIQLDKVPSLFDPNDSICCNRSMEERNEAIKSRMEAYVPVSTILLSKRVSRSTAPPVNVRKSVFSFESVTERNGLMSADDHFHLSPIRQTEEPGSSLLKGNNTPVLVVDDNTFNIMIVSSLLVKNGFTVTSAFNGEDAIKKVKEQDRSAFFKLIFMDCQMPVMDGFEATEILRQMMGKGEIPEIPILALTANDTKQDQEKCIKSGMSGHLTKPLKETELKKLIADFIKPRTRTSLMM